MNNILPTNSKPMYKPEVCRHSAGAQKGKPWQPFSYIVKRNRGQKPGTHNKPEVE